MSNWEIADWTDEDIEAIKNIAWRKDVKDLLAAIAAELERSRRLLE